MSRKSYAEWDNENEERLEREAERRRLEAEKKEAQKADSKAAESLFAKPAVSHPSHSTIERETFIEHDAPCVLKQNLENQPCRIFEGANGQFSFFEVRIPVKKGAGTGNNLVYRSSLRFDETEIENV